MELEIDFGRFKIHFLLCRPSPGLKLGPAVLCSSVELGTVGQPCWKEKVIIYTVQKKNCWDGNRL